MKFKVEATALHKKIQLASLVVTHGTLPILSNVILKLEGETLTITASNLNQIIRTSVEVFDASEDGAVTVSVAKLTSLLSSFSGGTMLSIDADIETAQFRISTESGKFMLVGLPEKDYPELIPVSVDKFYIVDTQALLRMINEVKASISKDDSRIVLTGVLLCLEHGRLNVVATDGKRLSVSSSVLDVNDSFKYIIPASAIPTIMKLTGDALDISVSENIIIIKGDNMTFYSKLIDGNYPNYQQVIPKSFSKSVEIPTEKLKSIVQRISILDDVGKKTMITLSENRIAFELSSTMGAGSDYINVELSLASPITVTMNVKYILDALVGAGEKIMLKFNDASSPFGFERASESFSVIMPMRGK